MTSHSTLHEELRTLLRDKQLRATSVRLAVLSTLHHKEAPMTHEQVMEGLTDGRFDKASVWRILSELADQKILRRMDLGDRVWRYELVDACRQVDADHAHFLCKSCGEVICLPPLEIRPQSGELPIDMTQSNFTVRIEGTCKVCTAALIEEI